MGDKKQVEKVVTLDQPGMTYVVTKEYLILPFTDIAINKKFFAYYTIVLLALFQATWGLVLGPAAVASFYYALLMMYVGFCVSHWLIIPIQIVCFSLIIFALWYPQHRRKKRQKEEARLAALRKQAYGGELSHYE